MSKQPAAPNPRLVERAALLRAQGMSWERVADLVGQSAETVKNWPAEDRGLWARCLAAAHRELDDETLGEVRTLLRLHLRTEDPKLACAIGRVLVALACRRPGPATTPPDPSPEHQRLANHLEGLSHDDLCAYVDTHLARLAGPGNSPEGSPQER